MAGGNYPAGPPPKEAVDYLRRKRVRMGYDYREVWREEHAIAFTVANMMKLDMLKDVQASITKALEEGTPADTWKKGMAEEMAKRGWWGRYQPPDPNDPKDVADAKRYMSWRLDTIWRVNTRQAAQAGVWERGQRSKSHPYILYRVGPSKKHREQHLEWNGVLLSKDDPFWAVANPMNGWGCKCYTVFVSRARYERYKNLGAPGVKDIKTEPPKLRVKRYKNDHTNTAHAGYEGIDEGFERNPGVGRMEQLGEQFRQRDGQFAAAGLGVSPVPPRAAAPGQPAVKRVEDTLSTDTYSDEAALGRLQHTIKAIDGVHSWDLPQLMLSSWAVPDGDGFSIPGVLIAVDPNSAILELTLAHEIGHQLKWQLRKRGADTADLFAVISDTKVYREFQDRYRGAKEHYKQDPHEDTKEMLDALRYLMHPDEIFARAYAQYVAWRSGDAALVSQIDALANETSVAGLSQWRYADFLPIALQFDMLLERFGWLTRT